MNINRDNYEEYFLLYADNELTDSGKAEVLLFVKNNKDLEAEFRMIHHTILKPDTNLHLTDKSFLLKNISSFINKKNYEEIFVLYHDKELNEQERTATEEFLSLHKELQNEFDLIGLARLTPESAVIFPGKKLLYKKEKDGKVIPLILWRMLAAAIFIGFIIWIGNLYFTKQKPAIVINQKEIPIKNKLPETPKPIIPDSITPEKKPDNSLVYHFGKEIKTKKEKQNNIAQKNNNNYIVPKNINQQQPGEEIADNTRPEKLNEKVSVTIKDINPETITTTSKIDPENNILKPEQTNEAKEEANDAHNASYLENTNEKNDNYVFYDIKSEHFKKTRLGGFLKKIRRVIERSNPIAGLISGDEHQVASK